MKHIATSIILVSCAVPLLLNCRETVLGGGLRGTGGLTGTATSGADDGGTGGAATTAGGGTGGTGGAATTAGGGGTGGCIPGTGGWGCYGGGCVLTSTTPVESNPLGQDWLETFNLAGSAYTCLPGNAGELTPAQCDMLCPPSVTKQPLQQCSVEVAGPNGGWVECRYSDCGLPCASY